MPRRKLARRFEPRYGVNQSMLEVESKWVERELEDQLISSTSDLRKHLADTRAKAATTEECLQATLSRLPDRERLALKAMIARDVFHMGALYESFLRSSKIVGAATGSSRETPEEIDQQGAARSVLVFQDSLFD
jgi:hypothetical protein